MPEARPIDTAPLRCLLVDDEPLAHRVLERYIDRIGYLTSVGSCFDGIAALERIGEAEVVFLDIQMPELTGLELLGALRQNAPLVVLTTAYSEYAVAGFGYDEVVDYLQKPIEFPRFLQTAERLRHRFRLRAAANDLRQAANDLRIAPPPADTLHLYDDSAHHFVPLADLRYVESYGNYVKAHTADRVFMGRRTLQDVAEELASAGFLRIHKRYVVNAALVRVVEGASVRIGETSLPIGRAYLQDVRRGLGIGG